MSHPSKKIIGRESFVLEGKKIVLGVTGSVSLYKSLDLARLLMRNGAEVTVVMSRTAKNMMSPTLFEWATGNKVYHTEYGGETGHIILSDTNDAMIIAPATLNTIVKTAYGITDSIVALTALSFIGRKKPLLMVPAMHHQLYDTHQYRESVDRLESMGVIIHPPYLEEDKVKYPDIKEVEWHLETILHRGKDLKGYKVLVTGGPTREYIDPVRVLTNPSTGKMGASIAIEAFYRGARVRFIHGPLCNVFLPQGVESIYTETTERMLREVVLSIDSFEPDVVVLSAAPTDFEPAIRYPTKLPSNKSFSIELKPTPKIIEAIKNKRSGDYRKPIIIGFAAETVENDEELHKHALGKLEKYDIDVVIANNVSRRDIGFESEYNEVLIVTRKQVEKIVKTSKKIVARKIIDIAGELLSGRE
jgi:phosphopantothenoylcysteine decarboxylase/phosphopantothenate--cysteine ligase